MKHILVRASSLLAAIAILAGLPIARAEMVFDLVSDFSTTQGQNGWSYGFLQTSTFMQPSDFKLMILDQESWVPDHNDQSLFPLGENGMWNQGGNAYTFTTIRSNDSPATLFFHPNADPSYDFGDLPNSLELPAAKWINELTETATVNISGLFGKVTGSIESRTDFGFELNDGFNFLVYRNQTLVETLFVPGVGFWDGEEGTSNRILHPYSFNVMFDPGDSLYIVQDALNSQRADHGYLTGTAVVVPEAASIGLLSIGVAGLGLSLAIWRRSHHRRAPVRPREQAD